MSTPPPPPAKIERNGKEEEEERSTATSKEKDGTHINIKVRGQAENEVLFCVKRDVKLRRLMDMYCARQSIHRHEVRFMEPGRGRIIRDEQTPDEVGFEDGDAILSLLYQSRS